MLKMFKPLILGQLRHLLTVGAGALVAYGYVEASNTEALVGIVLYAIGAGLSALDKKGQ